MPIEYEARVLNVSTNPRSTVREGDVTDELERTLKDALCGSEWINGGWAQIDGIVAAIFPTVRLAQAQVLSEMAETLANACHQGFLRAKKLTEPEAIARVENESVGLDDAADMLSNKSDEIVASVVLPREAQ